MSARELTRVEVLSRVKAGTLSLESAATLLAVSYRQAKRSGAAVSGGRGEGTEAPERGGRVESCAADGRTRAGVGARAGEVQRAGGCAVRADPGRRASGERRRRHGASRHVAAVDGDGGVVESRAGNASPHRQRRERKAHFGELVQLDGSFHLWDEARGAARLLDEPGRRCDRSDARAARGPRKRSGRRPMCCAGGSRRTACRWRSTRIGRMSMCGSRMRRSRPRGPCR